MGILEYTFFQNALIGSLLASIVCGIVGTYIVARRLVFICGGVTHASFGGIAIGAYIGVSPIAGAMAMAVASACGVKWLTERGAREDASIALFWTLGMSVGIIFSYLTPGFMPDLPSYLFGNILMIDSGDIALLAIMAAMAVVVAATLGRTLVHIAFDPAFARSQHLPVRALDYMAMALIALAIVSILRMVGIVLAMSLLTIPQMTAQLFTHDIRRMAVTSIAFSLAFSLAGLAIAYWIGIPSGATIIVVAALIYGTLKAIKQARQSFE